MCKPFLDGGNCQYDKREDSFRTDVGAVVKKRVDRCAEAIVCAVLAKKDHAGEEREKESTYYAEQITFDKPMFFIAENAGKSKYAEPEKIIGKHLRNTDDIRVYHKLQNAVSAGCHQAGT